MFQNMKVKIVLFFSVIYIIALVCMYAYEYHFKNTWFENKLEALEMSKLDKDISFSLDNLSVTDDGNMQLTGWAFINEVPAIKQKMVIIAQSDDDTQYLFASSFKRKDVTQSFDNKVNYDNSGFLVEFKPSKLKDSIYKVGIYLENGDRTAFIDTGSIMYKNGGRAELEHLSSRVDLTLKLEKRDMKYSIDAVEKKKFGIELVGWSFAENIDMRNSSTFILLDNGKGQKLIFDTIKIIRDDVKQKYEQENLEHTGFVVRIPYSEMSEEDEYKVSIVIRSDKDSIIKTDCVIQK